MDIAHHKHRDTVLGKVGVDGTDSLAGVGGVGDGLVKILFDFADKVSDFQCLAYTDGVEECQVVAVDAEGAVAFLAHNAVTLANHEHREAVLGKAGVEGADNFARVGGVGDGLVEVLLKIVFFAGIHIVLSIVPAYIIRRTSINNF